MTELEKLEAWLKTFPLWDGTLSIDVTDAVPGGMGVYPKGLQELSRREDVLGNLTVCYRWSFTLHRNHGAQTRENAHWLMQLQTWAAQQCRQGLAPQFGDVPTQERLRICEGSLVRRAEGGSGYTALLTADFTKIFRGE